MAGTTVNLKLLIAATNTASKEVVKLQGELNQLSRGADQLGKRSAEGAKVGKDGITDWGKSMESFTDKMGKAKVATEGFGTAGLALVGVAASLAAVTFFPVKAAADFEQALSGVIAVTDNAVEKFNELKNVAGELGRTTKFTATQAAEGMQYLGQAGFNAREVIEGIGPALQLAIAAAVSLGEASNIATNVLSGMRLPVSELTNVVDILAQTAAKSNAELLDMAEALSYAGPVASAAGVQIEELAALVGVLGNAGIQGSRAGTAIRNTLFGITKASGQTKAKLDELGVTVTKTADGGIDLIDVFHQLADAQIDVADAQIIFGRYAAAGVLAITSQIDSLDEMLIANNAAAGAAKKMADIMKDNLKGSVIELTSALDGLKRAFGDPLLGPLRSTTESVTFLVGEFTALAEKMPVTITLLGTLTVVAAAAALAVGGLGLAIGGMNTAFTVLGGKGMVNTIKGWKRFGSLTGVITAGVKKLFMVIKGHPFIALGVAVAGVVLWFSELSERTN
ncbi:MAG: phage tail tape measure protein, partial [Chloroflexi bacterium]|nr:phage tail tape measure protein [Chloroflexota bacterium]